MPHSVLTRGRKMVARLTALAMVASIMVVGALPASAEPVNTSATCPSGSIPSAGFVDIGAYAASSQLAINCLVYWDISKGTSATTYSPEMEVTRWQMALFLTRQAEVHGLALGDGSDQGFTDIGDYPAATRVAINQLAQLGITEGTSATTFSPGAAVPRWQMALFLTRLLDAAGYTLGDGSSQGLTDIGDYPASTRVAINQVVQAGVATGFTATTFGPGQNTNRVQMAIFLTRTLAAGGVVFPPSTNASFMVTAGGSSATQIVDTDEKAASVAYTASGLEAGKDYEIAVFTAGDSGQDASIKVDGMRYPNRNGQSTNVGTFTFRDMNLDDVADDSAQTQNGDAEIVVVDGINTIDRDYQVTATANANGVINFFVAVEADRYDVAVPVVWREGAGGLANGDLDLVKASTNSWNVPAEAFGVGPAVVFHQGEAPSGETPWEDVMFLDIDSQYMVLEDGYQLFWNRDGDSYYYYGSEAEGAISLDRFEEYLSIGDTIDQYDSFPESTVYQRSGDTIFQIYSDTPGTPLNVMLAVTDDDEITVTWSHPSPLEGNDDQARAAIHEVVNGVINTVPVQTEWTDEVDTFAPRQSLTKLVFVGLAAGTYIARVEMDSETDDSGDWSLASNAVTIEGPAGPTITSAVVTTDGPIIGAPDEDDVWTIKFSEAVTYTIEAQIWLVDADGDLIKVHNEAGTVPAGSTSATFAGDGTVTLTITLTDDPVNINVVGDGKFTYPLTITTTAGITAVGSGVAVDLVASTDVTVS